MEMTNTKPGPNDQGLERTVDSEQMFAIVDQIQPDYNRMYYNTAVSLIQKKYFYTSL